MLRGAGAVSLFSESGPNEGASHRRILVSKLKGDKQKHDVWVNSQRKGAAMMLGGAGGVGGDGGEGGNDTSSADAYAKQLAVSN